MYFYKGIGGNINLVFYWLIESTKAFGPSKKWQKRFCVSLANNSCLKFDSFPSEQKQKYSYFSGAISTQLCLTSQVDRLLLQKVESVSQRQFLLTVSMISPRYLELEDDVCSFSVLQHLRFLSLWEVHQVQVLPQQLGSFQQSILSMNWLSKFLGSQDSSRFKKRSKISNI